MTARRTGRARTIVLLVTITVMTVLAGLSFVSAFQARELGAFIALAAIAAVVLAWFVMPSRDRAADPDGRRITDRSDVVRWIVFVAVDAVALVIVGMIATRSASPATVIEGLRNGWALILSSAPPVDASGPAIVVPVVLTWIAATVSVVLLRTTRSAVLLMTPLVVLLVLGEAFGSADRDLPTIAIALLVAGSLIVVRLEPTRTEVDRAAYELTWRTGIVVAVVIATVTTLTVLVLPRLPAAEDRAAFRLREHYDPPELTQTAVNPLSVVTAAQRDAAAAAAAGNEPATAFTVDTDQPVDRFRLAVLDRYDGERWTTSSQFLHAGHELAPGPVTAPSSRLVHQRLKLQSVPGYWIPSAERPVGLSKSGFVTDPETGMLGTTTASSNGTEVEVDAAMPIYTADELRGAATPDTQTNSTDLDVPPAVNDAVRNVARQAVEGAESPLQRAYQIQEHLKNNLQLLPAEGAIPGHSLRRLTEMLTNPERRQGSSEQFATAFALLARLDGLPSRVVVGYQVAPGTGPQTVTQADMTAWPEVLFDGFGWVPFDPEPTTSGQQTPVQSAGTEAEEVESGIDDVIQEAATETGETDPANESDQAEGSAEDTTEDDSSSGLVPLVLLLLGAIVVVVVALALVTAMAKRRRRKARLNAGDERARVIGAWDDTLDHLAAAGIDVRGSLSATAVATNSADELDDHEVPLVPLARLSNLARFAPEPPSERDVDDAWIYASAIASRCSSRRSAGQRARSILDPRPAAARSQPRGRVGADA